MLRNYMYNGLQLQFEEKLAPKEAVLIEDRSAPKTKAQEPKNKARKPSTKEPGNGGGKN